MPGYFIKENSWIARVAAFKLKSGQVAIVIGRTIHLHNTSKEEFLNNACWVKHEMCHIRQFAEYGTLKFMAMYLYESILHGYYHNKYEKEAREAENK